MNKKPEKKGKKEKKEKKDKKEKAEATEKKPLIHLGDIFNGYRISKADKNDAHYLDYRFAKRDNIFDSVAFLTGEAVEGTKSIPKLNYWYEKAAEQRDVEEVYAVAKNSELDINTSLAGTLTGTIPIQAVQLALGGSISASTKYRREHHDHNWQVVHTSHYPYKYFELELDNLKEDDPKNYLREVFIEAVTELPTEIDKEEDFKKWVHFLSTYGTHFPVSVLIGGYLRAATKINITGRSAELGTTLSGWLKAAVQQTVEGKVEGSGSVTRKHDNWEIGTDISITSHGGKKNLSWLPIKVSYKDDADKDAAQGGSDLEANKQVLTEWKQSLEDEVNLAILHMEFHPIENLFGWILGKENEDKLSKLLSIRETFYPRLVVIYDSERPNDEALTWAKDHWRTVNAHEDSHNQSAPDYRVFFYEFKLKKKDHYAYFHLQSGCFLHVNEEGVIDTIESRDEIGASFHKIPIHEKKKKKHEEKEEGEKEEGEEKKENKSTGYFYLKSDHKDKYIGLGKVGIEHLNPKHPHHLICIDSDNKKKHGRWYFKEFSS